MSNLRRLGARQRRFVFLDADANSFPPIGRPAAARRPATLLFRDGAPDHDDDASANETGNEIADPAAEGDAEQPEDKARENGANDTQDDVLEHAAARIHEHAGQPTGDAANDDGRKPTYTVKSHFSPP